MFSFSKTRLLGLGLAVVLAACGPVPRSAEAQDMGDQLFASSERFKTRPQVRTRVARPFSKEDPARILVIGDSLADGFGFYLTRRVEERRLTARVVNRGRNSTGLSRSDYYDWPAEFSAEADATNPEILIAHFGSNDNQTIVLPDRRVVRGTDDWVEAYRTQTRRILEIAARHNMMVYLIGPAPDRDPSLNAHLTRINPIFAEEARRSGAVYLPLRPFTAGDGGAYIRSISLEGRSVAIRSGDGSHFTSTGYYLVADKILEDLARRVPAIFKGPSLELAGFLQ